MINIKRRKAPQKEFTYKLYKYQLPRKSSLTRKGPTQISARRKESSKEV
jgi:hypothetical protein